MNIELHERKFEDGQRVRLFGAYNATITSFDAGLGYYYALCDYCEKHHILLENDIAPLHEPQKEEQKHDSVGD